MDSPQCVYHKEAATMSAAEKGATSVVNPVSFEEVSYHEPHCPLVAYRNCTSCSMQQLPKRYHIASCIDGPDIMYEGATIVPNSQLT